MATLLGAGCASLPAAGDNSQLMSVNPALLDGFRPDFLYYDGMWRDYLKARGPDYSLNNQIDQCRQNPAGCPAQFYAWVNILDLINTLPADDKQDRLELIAYVTNVIMRSDPEKSTWFNALFPKGRWLQTIPETLIDHKGEGVCGDGGLLVYETAKRTGLTDVFLIGGIKPGFGFHTIAGVNLAGNTYVLDGFTVASYKQYVNGMKIGTDLFSDPFLPLFKMDEGGTKLAGDISNIFKVSFIKSQKLQVADLPPFLGLDNTKRDGKIASLQTQIWNLVADGRMPARSQSMRLATPG